MSANSTIQPTLNARIFLTGARKGHRGSGDARIETISIRLSDRTRWTAAGQFCSRYEDWRENDEVFVYFVRCMPDDSDYWVIVNITRSVGEISQIEVGPEE